ncbi:39S ribosomal protein L35, mitochondrial-like [Mizuhopecten yessoensis]|uniref:Large ribosomal subunit protein bL35m n=1 Tax=Mizuhopecten yessoensis TaxID=6573 RepID=A0A210QKM5_MIZYE|nr:39S ribosomal protein L35, mitochondrial-like [Mizuhopecten yessoensis]OWF49282.1 39S ribosomal protein L35, mitochondrial [Mizuhopecten yessoensis]
MAAPLKQCLLGMGNLTSKFGRLAVNPRQMASINRAVTYCVNRQQFSVLASVRATVPSPTIKQTSLPTSYHGSLTQLCSPFLQPVRTKTMVSFKKGKQKTVPAVVARFKRMEWGGWIRTKSGKNKRMWAKSLQRRYRLQQHVMCNGQQSKLLDKMVTGYWRRHRHYPDDPYAPYHKRTNILNSDKSDVPPFLP